MKGKLEDMMAKARFTPGAYFVQYRDFKEVVQLPVSEFWKIAEIVPAHRIARIIKLGESESEKEVLYESSDANLLALPVRVEQTVDEETLRFVEMRDALATKYPWQRYIQLERIKRMKEEGRELLGEIIYIQPKRDGENVSLWLEGTDAETGTPHVSSHNMVNADPSIVKRFMATKEFEKAVELLRTEKQNFNKNLILYGELINIGRGPTRIEPPHKKARWYLFDIYDITNKAYYTYPLVYQTAYHYNIPIIEALETWMPWRMEDIEPKITEWKKWCKRHRREGVVGKVYKNGVLFGFKEKIDLPDLPPIAKEIREKATFPPMPSDRILRALQHSWDELTSSVTSEEEKEALWKDKAKAMPIIAKHIATEAKEHNFNPPRNIFEVYMNTSIAEIRERPQTP